VKPPVAADKGDLFQEPGACAWYKEQCEAFTVAGNHHLVASKSFVLINCLHGERAITLYYLLFQPLQTTNYITCNAFIRKAMASAMHRCRHPRPCNLSIHRTETGSKLKAHWPRSHSVVYTGQSFPVERSSSAAPSDLHESSANRTTSRDPKDPI